MTNILGQGAYGCVIKPPAKCKSSNNIPLSVYDGAVSKLLSKTQQNTEIKEYTNFAKIDPTGKWFMPKPIACDAEDETFGEFAQCKMYPNISKTPHALLIIRDGGIDLSNYCQYIRLNKSLFTDKKIHNVFSEGLKIDYTFSHLKRPF